MECTPPITAAQRLAHSNPAAWPQHSNRADGTIRALQESLLDEHGLDVGPVDGKFGWRTDFALARLRFRERGGRIWVWGQSDKWAAASRQRTIHALGRWGATDYVFGLNDQEDVTFKLDQPVVDYVAMAAELAAADIRTHLMTWARVDRDFIRASADHLIKLAESTNAASVQLDAEEAWRAGAKRRPPHEAAADVEDFFDDLPDGCALGVTSYASLPISVAPLVRVCDYGVPQAYSQYGDEADRQTPTYLPPRTQQLARERWEPQRKPLVYGLAAYNQSRPGRTEAEEVARAFTAAVRCGADAVAYWSRIHLVQNEEVGATVARILKGE